MPPASQRDLPFPSAQASWSAVPYHRLSTESSAPGREGARQICEMPRVRRLSAPRSPRTSAEPAAAEGDDGVGSGEGPFHPGALEPVADHPLAAGLDDARGDSEVPGRGTAGRAHPAAVAEQAADAPAGFGGGLFALRVPGGDPQCGRDPVQPPVVQLLMPLPGPGAGFLGPGAVEGLGGVGQMLPGLVDVDDFDGARETARRPDSRSSRRRRRGRPAGARRRSRAATLRGGRAARTGDGCGSVSRAVLSTAALQLTEPGSRTGLPRSSRDSAVQTTASLTSRVLAAPPGCLPRRPSTSEERTGTPVPSSPRYIVSAGPGAGSTTARSSTIRKVFPRRPAQRAAPAAGAGHRRAGVVAPVRVQPPLHHPRRDGERFAAHRLLDSLQIPPADRVRGCQSVDFRADLGR